MRDKIPCGGFYLDDTLKVDENNMLGLAPGAGGVQKFEMKLSQDESGPHFDRTFAELQEAYLNGKYIDCFVNEGSGNLRLPVTMILFIKDNKALFIINEYNNITYLCLDANDETQEIFHATIPVTPESSDYRKFLSVDGNGNYTLTSDIVIPSSTSGSTKKFKITVDDSGAITATEITT